MDDLKSQKAEIDQIRQETLAQLEALTSENGQPAGEVTAGWMPGDSGLTEISDLDDGEFDFTQAPAM